MARGTAGVRLPGRVLLRDGARNGVRGGSNRGGKRSSARYAALPDGYAALAAPARPGQAPTVRQHACSAVALRVRDAERVAPELRGGAVRVDPESLGRELRARYGQAQELRRSQETSSGQAAPEVVAAEAALQEAATHAELIRQQEVEPKAKAKRLKSRRDGQRVAAESGAELDPELSEEFESDPELAGSDAARRKEAKNDPAAPDPASDPDLAQAGEPTARPRAGKPATIDAGTARKGATGKVFDISSMPRRAPAGRRTGAATARPSTPARKEGVRGWSPQARSAHSREALWTTGVRTGVIRPGKSQRGERVGTSSR